MGLFIQKLIIFDPLDRKIIGYEEDEEVDRATKRNELIQMLVDMQSINGPMLNAPLSKKNHFHLGKLFDS